MIGFGEDEPDAAVELLAVEILPAAIESGIEGLFWVTKFPKIASRCYYLSLGNVMGSGLTRITDVLIKARTKSGPCTVEAGPK